MNQFSKAPIKRSELKPGEHLCDYCTARCCRYFALPIETPETLEDFEYVRWFGLHEGATFFTEHGTWYLLMHSPCMQLQSDNRCGIYETRPTICREYSTDDCEFDCDQTYDNYFELPEQLNEYINARFHSPDNFRSPKPTGLPVISFPR